MVSLVMMAAFSGQMRHDARRRRTAIHQYKWIAGGQNKVKRDRRRGAGQGSGRTGAVVRQLCSRRLTSRCIALARGVDDDVGYFAVERVALGKQAFQLGSRVGGLQQRAVFIVLRAAAGRRCWRAGKSPCRWRPPATGGCPVVTAPPPVASTMFWRSASSAMVLRLRSRKAGSPRSRKSWPRAHRRAPDFVVGVVEGFAGFTRQSAPDGGFTRPHQPDQKEIASNMYHARHSTQRPGPRDIAAQHRAVRLAGRRQAGRGASLRPCLFA